MGFFTKHSSINTLPCPIKVSVAVGMGTATRPCKNRYNPQTHNACESHDGMAQTNDSSYFIGAHNVSVVDQIEMEDLIKTSKKQEPKMVNGIDVKEKASLTGSVLLYSDLREQNLDFSNLTEAKISNSECQGLSLSKALLVKTSIRSSNLEGSNFDGCIITDSHFDAVNLNLGTFNESTIDSTEVYSCSGYKAAFRNSLIKKSLFSSSDFSFASFRNSNLKSTSFINTTLRKARFVNTNLSETTFDNSRCNDVDFSGSNLTNASFVSADLRGANFSDASGGLSADFKRASYNFETILPIGVDPKKHEMILKD